MAVISITDESFEKEVTNHKGLVLVDFWAPWCGPCRILGPVIEELSKEVGDDAKITKINIEENKQVAGKLQIMSIPTVILFKDGKPVETWIGIRNKSEYLNGIQKQK